MKKRASDLLIVLLSVIIILSAAVSAVGCGDEKKKSSKKDKDRGPDIDIDIELDDDQLVFYSEYSNYAWGYEAYSTFYMGNGDVYSCSLYMDRYPDNYSDDLEKLEYLRAFCEPTAKIDPDELKELYANAIAIKDELGDFEEEFFACDAGDSSTYFVDPDTGEYIKFYVGGCYESVTDNDNLEDFWKMWRKKDVSSLGSPALLITNELPIYSREIDYSFDSRDGNYIFTNLETLYAKAEEWDIDLSDLDFEYNDSFVYVVEIETTTPAPGLHSAAFLIDDNVMRFLPPLANLSDIKVYDRVATYISIIPIYLYNYDNLYTKDGDVWQIIGDIEILD